MEGERRPAQHEGDAAKRRDPDEGVNPGQGEEIEAAREEHRAGDEEPSGGGEERRAALRSVGQRRKGEQGQRVIHRILRACAHQREAMGIAGEEMRRGGTGGDGEKAVDGGRQEPDRDRHAIASSRYWGSILRLRSG